MKLLLHSIRLVFPPLQIGLANSLTQEAQFLAFPLVKPSQPAPKQLREVLVSLDQKTL